ncbi:hypothetical protein ACFQ7B_11880 [Streptomyces erythrochromogenes]
MSLAALAVCSGGREKPALYSSSSTCAEHVFVRLEVIAQSPLP